MWKIIGGVVIGVFVGALAYEIILRKRPDLIKNIESSAEGTAQSFMDAFQEGYQGLKKKRDSAAS
jgi:hypothetical protein